MTTLRTPRQTGFSPEDRVILERTAKRTGHTAEARLASLLQITEE